MRSVARALIALQRRTSLTQNVTDSKSSRGIVVHSDSRDHVSLHNLHSLHCFTHFIITSSVAVRSYGSNDKNLLAHALLNVYWKMLEATSYDLDLKAA